MTFAELLHIFGCALLLRDVSPWLMIGPRVLASFSVPWPRGVLCI